MKRMARQKAQAGSNRKSPDARLLEDLTIAAPERFPVALRAYVSSGQSEKPTGSFAPSDAGPSHWSIIFDTETTTDAAQRCRFGSYQVREHDQLHEHGLFYDPEVLKPGEQATLQKYARSRNLELRTVSEFIDEVFFAIGYDFRASIVGFNLPFDLSRLAFDYDDARDHAKRDTAGGPRPRRGMSMRGGFSFKLSRNFWRPRIQIKHHSRSLAFIRFTAEGQFASRSERKRKRSARVRRGYFLDVRTTAAALTSQLHSLGSLADALGVTQRKSKTDEHGKRLTVTISTMQCRTWRRLGHALYPFVIGSMATNSAVLVYIRSTARRVLERLIFENLASSRGAPRSLIFRRS